MNFLSSGSQRLEQYRQMTDVQTYATERLPREWYVEQCLKCKSGGQDLRVI